MPDRWDPDRYLAYAGERGRPYLDLLARIGAASPRRVVDLGCGPGTLTVMLRQRWPEAEVLGVDSSPAMVQRARTLTAPDLAFEQGDLRDWRAAAPVDVLISNATLQWIPGHLELLPALAAAIRPGGWLALSVPGNFAEPSHLLRRELAAEEPYAALTAGLPEPAAHDPEAYLNALARLGGEVDAWETTYLHALSGPDPVFAWISGTSAGPALSALDADPPLRAAFERELRRRLSEAYPAGPSGSVLFRFRRVFAVARLPEWSAR